MMGGDHAERIAHRLANSTLVAVSDPDTERAHALADRFEGVRTVGDPLDLIADDGIDGVIVASPGFVHEEQVLACIDRKSTRLNSSHANISYAVFCLKKTITRTCSHCCACGRLSSGASSRHRHSH